MVPQALLPRQNGFDYLVSIGLATNAVFARSDAMVSSLVHAAKILRGVSLYYNQLFTFS